jgi:uncharacterized protein (TIGR00266 family)
MEYQIEGGNTFPLVRVELAAGEMIKAESGSMVAMSQDIHLKGRMDGGVKGAIGRMFTGESFFLQSLEAHQNPGWALLSTAQMGMIAPIALDGREWILQKNGFVAASQDVKISTKVQSLARGFLGGEGFFVIRMGGTGTAFVSTYGAIYNLDIPAGESVVIDNGHLVAWHADMNYQITKGARSWVSSVTSGEGLACRFKGPGQVMIQTRNPRDFGNWIQKFLPQPKERR